jgi:hypothetical protein
MPLTLAPPWGSADNGLPPQKRVKSFVAIPNVEIFSAGGMKKWSS